MPWRIQQVIDKVKARAAERGMPPEMVEMVGAQWRNMIGWFVQYEEEKLRQQRSRERRGAGMVSINAFDPDHAAPDRAAQSGGDRRRCSDGARATSGRSCRSRRLQPSLAGFLVYLGAAAKRRPLSPCIAHRRRVPALMTAWRSPCSRPCAGRLAAAQDLGSPDSRARGGGRVRSFAGRGADLRQRRLCDTAAMMEPFERAKQHWRLP